MSLQNKSNTSELNKDARIFQTSNNDSKKVLNTILH